MRSLFFSRNTQAMVSFIKKTSTFSTMPSDKPLNSFEIALMGVVAPGLVASATFLMVRDRVLMHDNKIRQDERKKQMGLHHIEIEKLRVTYEQRLKDSLKNDHDQFEEQGEEQSSQVTP